MDAAVIEKEAMLLSDTQRALLADRLLASLESMSSKYLDQWVAEADARMAALSAGEIEALDGPSTIASIQARFRK